VVTAELDRLPAADVPLALAGLHRELGVGAHVRLRLPESPLDVTSMVIGGGFDVVTVSDDGWSADAIRARTLPDYVGPGMRILMVGLNPSVYAADAGVGFARPGNRFWPAMARAGLTTVDRDPRHLLDVEAIGMTDLVKRASQGAGELGAEELRTGFERVVRLVEWLEPGVVCVLGVTGWRHAVDRRASLGWQCRRIGDRPVYVMPNPSGANAHARVEDLVAHLRALDSIAEIRTGPTTGDQRAPRTAHAPPLDLDAPGGVGQALDVATGEEDLTSMGRAVHVQHHAVPTIRETVM
jgi:TDG/mug DNA glycosylase family protein